VDRQERGMNDHCQEEQGMKLVDEMKRLRELWTSDVEEMVVESHRSQMSQLSH
jgi:hypothetical protein